MKRIFIILLALNTPAFALFCPNNFNEIHIGDSLEMVKLQCGEPTAEKTSENNLDTPQEWVYYVQMSPTDQATLRMTVAFNHGTVTNMSVNGIGVSATAICNNTNVSVGNSVQSIRQICGEPAFISRGSAPTTSKVTTLNYGTGSGTTLTFEEGVLKSRD